LLTAVSDTTWPIAAFVALQHRTVNMQAFNASYRRWRGDHRTSPPFLLRALLLAKPSRPSLTLEPSAKTAGNIA
jgi:hypothetical protein